MARTVRDLRLCTACGHEAHRHHTTPRPKCGRCQDEGKVCPVMLREPGAPLWRRSSSGGGVGTSERETALLDGVTLSEEQTKTALEILLNLSRALTSDEYRDAQEQARELLEQL